ncbi:MAG: hypothetical protein HC933_02395 [Pleurocapsa sp. SU_196_0]|nr:hypothetical protein [Pleurocapsa sp. SU_196_0]
MKLEVTGHGQALTASNELERAVLNLCGNAVRYAASSVTWKSAMAH